MINIANTNIHKCKDCFAFRHCKTCIGLCVSKNKKEIIMEDSCKNIRYDFHNNLIGMKTIEELRNDKEYDYA